jgi:hypothetical protein
MLFTREITPPWFFVLWRGVLPGRQATFFLYVSPTEKILFSGTARTAGTGSGCKKGAIPSHGFWQSSFWADLWQTGVKWGIKMYANGC